MCTPHLSGRSQASQYLHQKDRLYLERSQNNSLAACKAILQLPGNCAYSSRVYLCASCLQVSGRQREVYDAVVVTVGNYHEPNLVIF